MFTSKEKRTRWLMENKPLRDLKHLHQVGVIGNGTFGQVIRAMDSDNKVEVAVKRVKQDHLDFPVTALREISLLQILRHENIVNLMEVCIDEQCLYIVLEYADHDLAGLISSKDMELTSTHIKVFMKQLLQGIDFIHRCFVLHRDLKPANILVNKRGVLKIADWGMAKSLEKLPTQLTPQLVTLWYRAPEMLLGCESYGTAVDMWSIGIIFADMICKRPFMPGNSEIDQFERIIRLCGTPEDDSWFREIKQLKCSCDMISHLCTEKKKPPTHRKAIHSHRHHAQEEGLDLLVRLLTMNPNNRISADEALDHDYFWKTKPVDPKTLKLPITSTHEYDISASYKWVQNRRNIQQGAGEL